MFDVRKALLFCLCFLPLAMGWWVVAAEPEDQPATSTTTRWVKEWNAHDAIALGNLLTPDAEFVLVSGMLLRGREDFTLWHGQLFAGRYGKSVFRQDGPAELTMIRPDIALIHWRWSISGVENPDGNPVAAYRGIFTWVLIKTDGQWLIRAAQNTIDEE
ncbi:SgcJ/EcaC family oxidoreductase [Paraburkholderia sp. C35]|uniref:SgcJ/EcaC family oxidoreductase n=1 Tax=Paraburkholderia sp. C35 TaxID=2126993 RepID=UPI000D686B29|nr:SgcJ/EcaC family oxidoreductase [Paraburkholderia sp. C35]